MTWIILMMLTVYFVNHAVCAHKVIHIESRETCTADTNAHSIIPQAIHTIDNNNNIHNKSNASSNDGGGGGSSGSSNNDIIITTAAAILWRAYHTQSCMFKRQCERAWTSECVCAVCSRSKWINAKETTQFGWRIKEATTPPPLITAATTTITTTNTLCESTNVITNGSNDGVTAIVMTVYV